MLCATVQVWRSLIGEMESLFKYKTRYRFPPILRAGERVKIIPTSDDLSFSGVVTKVCNPLFHLGEVIGQLGHMFIDVDPIR